MPVQAKKRNVTLMAKDKRIFLFRKGASEANEGREIIPKRSKKNLKISVWIQLEKRRAPGWPSSARMRRLRAVPTIPAHASKIRCGVPISLWLVENSQYLLNTPKKNKQLKHTASHVSVHWGSMAKQSKPALEYESTRVNRWIYTALTGWYSKMQLKSSSLSPVCWQSWTAPRKMIAGYAGQLFASTSFSSSKGRAKRSRLPNTTYFRNSIKAHRHDQTQVSNCALAVSMLPVRRQNSPESACGASCLFHRQKHNSSLKKHKKGCSVIVKDEVKFLLLICVCAAEWFSSP